MFIKLLHYLFNHILGLLLLHKKPYATLIEIQPSPHFKMVNFVKYNITFYINATSITTSLLKFFETFEFLFSEYLSLKHFIVIFSSNCHWIYIVSLFTVIPARDHQHVYSLRDHTQQN